ncbi:MAG: glutamyl-tRNA amidotransferase [Candidatus Vogelbacteria bacterium CG10_big_fil_rev_8_21_14_0_10_45_14]|uniref:Glutamyl-tRNA amidotransferase n=1 Tax=Candidatus Vogelbacteria bacterium CG10_big_fil_rev_8_21_14_0_10_45_14 TaxID=1975042 RepID=A0A2H0RJZ0_9BACT|nr:MAG: glutamyl-tRNA amidotransferase [Candidatus Vogelbacteria bacterium CG10_big_fil_rev_8_21_14_0_10_45_14]
MLQQQIKDSIKDAMKAKDAVRLSVLRGLSTDFTNELVAKGKMPTDMLSDEDALLVIKRASKRRKDSIEQYEKGGRPELAEDEKAELTIIETFLPQAMGRDEIKKIAQAKIAELGINDKSQIGTLMGAIMKETGGNADGNDVKAVVNELLN